MKTHLGPVRTLLDGVQGYIATRFPIATQGGTVLSAYLCCYLLYGQVYGRQVFSWTTVVGGLSAVLLALVRRIVDDVEDLHRDLQSGRFVSPDGGRLRGLVIGGAVTTAVVGAINATCSLTLALVGVGVAMWFVAATAMKHTPLAQTSQAVFYTVNETCPVVGLLYPYVVWREVVGTGLPTMAVVVTIGLFWTVWQFWMFTRKVGAEGWPPWFLSLDETRNALISFLVLTAVFSAMVDFYAALSFGFLLYSFGLSAVFAWIILRWWARLPAQGAEQVGAAWGGVAFPVAVEAGVLVSVLAVSL